jgi:signal transduction histidine kinase
LHPKVCEGEGVGLAMLERIVMRHRGRAWFESEEGVGTTFFVDLHAADAVKPT